jgi:RNA polymerase-binding transcription factor
MQVNEESRGRVQSFRMINQPERNVSGKTIDNVRRDLDWMRQHLIQRLRRIREDAAHRGQPLSADSSDRAQETENDEVLERLDRSTVRLIDDYRHAIERIDQGRYGTCEACGFAIERERLQVVPQATRCVECAGVRAKAA